MTTLDFERLTSAIAADTQQAATPLHLFQRLDQVPAAHREWLASVLSNDNAARPVPLHSAGRFDGFAAIVAEPAQWALAAIVSDLPPGTYRVATAAWDGAQQYLAARGFALAQYGFSALGQSDAATKTLLVSANEVAALHADLVAETMVRDLVNTPAEQMGPAELSIAAKSIADAHGGQWTEIVGDDLLAQHFPSVHVVGRASPRQPRLIELNFGADRALPLLVLVGKGVCFDSGGLNIKGASGMRLMKKDMGGAAHVLGLASLLLSGNVPVRLRVIIGAVDNAIDGSAYRPGDVIPTRKGLSVEIGNTDAEGRIVLSDCVSYASEVEPDLILDFATLTGAARVALGADVVPFYTGDDGLAQALSQASNEHSDPLWRMPLYAPYDDQLSSNIADLSHIGNQGAFAGSMVAALYLQRFVNDPKRWAHFDVYAWNKSNRPGRMKGGIMQGLHAVHQVLADRYRITRK